MLCSAIYIALCLHKTYSKEIIQGHLFSQERKDSEWYLVRGACATFSRRASRNSSICLKGTVHDINRFAHSIKLEVWKYSFLAIL